MTRAQLEELIRALNDVVLIRKDLMATASSTCHLGALGVLSALSRLGAIRVSHLAEYMQVDVSVASRQLAQLESAGYVGRHRDPNDGRAHLVFVTEAGQRELDGVRASVASRFEAALDGWTGEELTLLTAQLDRLRGDLERARPTRNSGHLDQTTHGTGVKALS
ncbi:MarR family winged helix-turn-helix transcriptional regulator [Actinopolymorpha pittospori]|uniref:DNA-binding MarR family transcriptional regulator n=1 Tax=Actinopolymorpha pittospori TaxID=648752 RepID=A0A927RLN1_9ACTN|nr:MarR family transcriptional regulator [Actinopolymorpha pittospori]MBE1609376.1 DNA-binding MarR family transcriptional regulator [Actinopolymorpha pittospori]